MNGGVTWDQVREQNPGLSAEVTADGTLCRTGSRTFLASSPDDAMRKLASRPPAPEAAPMVPVPGAPVVITGRCPCGAVIPPASGSAHNCGLCYWCCPDMAARRAALKARADKAVADLAASVSPSGRR